MNRRLPHLDSRIAELLTDRATDGLSAAQSRELDLLLEQDLPIDTDAVDVAAAALNVYWVRDEAAPLPARLKRRILADYDQRSTRLPVRQSDARGASDVNSLVAADSPARRHPFGWQALGWYAAAASFTLAVAAWWPAAKSDLPPANQRRALLESDNGIIQVAWSPSTQPGYESVLGDVVWSDTRQTGFIRLKGLPPNDKSKRQYQLWIVDPSRAKHPVDGGVFDIASMEGEAVIPIDAKLSVHRPAVFAITLEPVGGVVVSDGPLLVTARVPGDAS